MKTEIRALDPATYVAHEIHRVDRIWPESNCYIDLWTEVLHSLGQEPLAALGHTLRLDFEGDQLTFFKYPLADLWDLYRIDVIELNIWRDLVGHTREQVAMGRPVIVEMDAFHLPDTAGVSFEIEHVKTSIGVNEIDVEEKRLGYFHNKGYYALSGKLFDAIFRLTPEFQGPNVLAPYVEVAKVERMETPDASTLAKRSHTLLRAHFARRPRENPFTRFRPRFERDVEWLRSEPLTSYHTYAFATLRQSGAAFELCVMHLRWLAAHGYPNLGAVADAFEPIAGASKTLMLRIARAVNGKKPLDAEPSLVAMEQAWSKGMELLSSVLG